MKKYWLFYLSFTFLLTACNWKVFDDFEKQATVQVIEPPGNFVGTNFGQVVSVVLDANGNVIENVFLVGGNGTTPLAIVRVDETNGSVSRTACVSDIGIPVSALTPLPSKNGRWRAIVSDGNYESVYVVSFDPNEEKPHITIESNLSALSPLFGIATLAGDFNRDGTLDVAIASSDHIYFFNDTLGNQQSCTLPSEFRVLTPQDAGTRIFVPFVRNNQLLLALSGQIKNQNNETAWAVLFINSSCENQILQGEFSSSNNQACSLSVGNINADENDDLVVGICHSTLLFEATNSTNSRWFDATPKWTLQENEKMLGKIVALMDINQDGKLELAISDPEQAINAQRNGEVLFYDVDNQNVLLRLSSPPDEKRFGSSLFSLPTIWLNGRHELVVGGANASYLFFLTGLSGDDDPQQHDPRP